MSHDDNCGCSGHGPLDLTKKHLSRRDVLRASLVGAGIFAMGPLGKFASPAYGAPQALKRMVVINMFGGADTLNMFIPHTLANYQSRRVNATAGTSIFVDTSTVPDLGGPYPTSAFKLHPSMPKITALWNEGGVAAVNKVGFPRMNQSHFEHQDIMSRGVRDGFGPLGVAESGWLARFADRLPVPTSLGAVGLGVGRPLDFIGGTSNPLAVNSLGSFNFSGATSTNNARRYRNEQAKAMIARYSSAGKTKASRDAMDQAYVLTQQLQQAITDFGASTYAPLFPNTGLSNRLKDAATLIEGGFETRIFYTGFGGFDTHDAQGANTGALPNLLVQLDNAVGALADYAKQRGIWNDMAVVVVTEFGRRNYVNGSNGCDHGHAFTALVIGGAAHGGVYGPALVDADLGGEYLSYGVDFRSVYKNVLANHMSADPAPVFPETLAINENIAVY